MSTLKVNSIEARTGTTISVASGQKLTGAAGSIAAPGHIIQHVQTIAQGTTTLSASGAFVNLTDLNCTITPKFSSSKVLVQIMFNYSTSTAGCGNGIALDREVGGSTTSDIARGLGASTADFWLGLTNNIDQSNSGGLVLNANGQFLDSPNTTSAVLYKPKIYFVAGTTPIKMNRSNAGNLGGMSSMMLMEIAQ